ncbi:MAG: DUF4861 family protein [Balneolaceae bacterium]|nr:DUF4861 family protein [Balneolaceae bacterium]
MSIITTADNFVNYGSRKFTGGSVDSTAFIELNLTQNQPVSYKFIAGWETGNPKFGDSQVFEDFVLFTGRRMQNPVQIEFKNQ